MIYYPKPHFDSYSYSLTITNSFILYCYSTTLSILFLLQFFYYSYSVIENTHIHNMGDNNLTVDQHINYMLLAVKQYKQILNSLNSEPITEQQRSDKIVLLQKYTTLKLVINAIYATTGVIRR